MQLKFELTYSMRASIGQSHDTEKQGKLEHLLCKRKVSFENIK